MKLKVLRLYAEDRVAAEAILWVRILSRFRKCFATKARVVSGGGEFQLIEYVNCYGYSRRLEYGWKLSVRIVVLSRLGSRRGNKSVSADVNHLFRGSGKILTEIEFEYS